MNRKITSVACTIACAGLSEPSRADLLAAASRSGFFGQFHTTTIPPFSTCHLGIRMVNTNAPPLTGYLFGDEALTAASAGQLLSADTSRYPALFPQFTSALTDGIAENVYSGGSINGTDANISSALEHDFFGLAAGQTDLAGANITLVTMHIDALTFTEVPVPGGLSTRVDWSATFSVYGTVPSPAPIAALMAVLLPARRRRA